MLRNLNIYKFGTSSRSTRGTDSQTYVIVYKIFKNHDFASKLAKTMQNPPRLEVVWILLKLYTTKFESKRSSLGCDPLEQKNLAQKPGMKMLTVALLVDLISPNGCADVDIDGSDRCFFPLASLKTHVQLFHIKYIIP